MKNSTKRTLPVFIKGALATVTLAASIAASTSSSQAMVIHNCTDQGLNVRLEGKQGGPKPKAFVEAQSSKAIHSTKRFGPYRIVLPILGEGGWFSGRKWNGNYSLVRSQGGNIGLRNGNACEDAGSIDEREPDYDRRRGQRHIAFCYRKYRSYREWDNTYQPYGGGPRRECRSGLL